MASFTKEVHPRLAKRALVFNGRLANRRLTSLVKEATGVYIILSCNRTVVADPSAISRQSVGDHLGSDRQPIGDRSATGWRLYLERFSIDCRKSAHFWRSVGDWSAFSRRIKTLTGLSLKRIPLQRFSEMHSP